MGQIKSWGWAMQGETFCDTAFSSKILKMKFVEFSPFLREKSMNRPRANDSLAPEGTSGNTLTN